MLALVKTDVNQLEIADVLGEYYGFRLYGKVDDMVALYIVESVHELGAYFFKMFSGDLFLLEKSA